ncbi:hypothetical protein BaRGS_00004820 [Batillaria attramentaria]|uniref:Uncharacterized protein n=1 Tax=Batillaria attramentaria TaxID=370345 RepID=A0ABD0LY99_9CAEN
MERLVIQGSTMVVVPPVPEIDLLCSETLDDPNPESDFESILDSGDSYHPSSSSSDRDHYLSEEELNPKRKRTPRKGKVPRQNHAPSQNYIDTQETNNETKKAKWAKRGMPEEKHWIRKSNREFRRKGKAYETKYKTKRGETIMKHQPPRQQGPPCSSAFCRKSAYKSCASISSEDRKQLLTSFWEEMTWKQRKACISSLVFDRHQKIKTFTRETRRKCTLVYYLRIKDEPRQVCKQMFLGTFGLKEWTVSSWKKDTHGWRQTVHSAIERKLLNCQIYWPAEYIEVITSARTKPEPYHVKNLTFEFFLDFSKLSFCKTIRPGRRPGDPQVTDIRALKYGTDGIIQYKLHHSDEWSPLPSRNSNRNAPVTIPKMYSQPIPIKKTKFEDLQQLKEVIPREYHTFYDQPPHQ